MNSAKLKAWYQASRPPFFIATLIPLAIGGRLAMADGEGGWLMWAAIVFASFLVHMNANLSNDYFEFENDSKDESIGGTRVLQQGLISIKEMKTAIILLYMLAFLIGIWILVTSHALLLIPYILFAALSSLFYTAPPIRYAYRGVGEIMVGLNMGPVMVTGTLLAMRGSVTGDSFLISIPVAVGVAFILFYQSLSDMDIDRKSGKFTLSVRLGRDRIRGAVWTFGTLGILSVLALTASSKLGPAGWLSPLSYYFIYRIDRLWSLRKSDEEMHGQGHFARFYYLFNGILVLLALQ